MTSEASLHRPRSPPRPPSVAAGLTACSVRRRAGDADNVVTIGYQSKTINTVTAGTLLREQGYFEEQARRRSTPT